MLRTGSRLPSTTQFEIVRKSMKGTAGRRPLGRKILELQLEQDDLLDTVWLATSRSRSSSCGAESRRSYTSNRLPSNNMPCR